MAQETSPKEQQRQANAKVFVIKPKPVKIASVAGKRQDCCK